MIRSRSSGMAALLAVAAALSACGEDGIVAGSGDGAVLDVQAVHPSGVVLQVLNLRTGEERTAVDLLVMNGRDREIRLNQGRESTFILTDGGEKLVLLAPATNTDLAVPGRRSADLTLVFDGGPPRNGTATLVLNERGSLDSALTPTPRFEVELPLGGARGTVETQSSMANLRPVAMTTIGPADGQGSTLGSSMAGGSNLQVVEALRTELGAVSTERGTLVSLAGDVTFDFDRATLRPAVLPTLDRLARLIMTSGEGEVAIEGHTDSRGTDAYNRRLSLARADAVKAYLVEQGVPAERLGTAGFAATRPVAPNANPDGSDNEAGRQQNRRVEVILPNG